MLNVTIEELSDAVVLHCVGRIVRGEESAILCAAVRRHGRDIILDLSEVEGIDAAGVGALIALQAAGVYLKLSSPTKTVREVLRLTKLESVFEIKEPAPETSAIRIESSAKEDNGGHLRATCCRQVMEVTSVGAS